MSFPESTYRLQFHAGFTFRDATAIVPYLHALGITHVYASPYFKARPGSTHGYDVIDHNAINPEVGTNDNRWWNDVLEKGTSSNYRHYFDIAWRGSPRTELHDKVLLPVLGAPY